MRTEERRTLLRTLARTAAAATIGALAAMLALRRRPSPDEGYCDRAGRCGGCPVTADCDVYGALHGGGRR